MVLLHLLVAQDDDLQDNLTKRSRVKLSQGIIGLFSRLCAYGEMNMELKNSPLPCKSSDALCAKNEKLQHETSCRNKHVEALRRACDNLDFENDELRSSLANLQSEIDLLKSNASMSCNSCVALNINLDVARSKIVLLETSASLSCVSCESLLARINELKLTHTTCVDELEHARAEICELKSMPCTKCSLLLVEGACHTSCDDDNALRDVNDVACSCDFVCTSCIDLESEVLALKKMRDDMSAKLVEHDEMSANLEKENELLRTTYAKCIEEEINNLRKMTCGTCERLKSQNEVFAHKVQESLCQEFGFSLFLSLRR
jgi:chromosome segregation ATPase